MRIMLPPECTYCEQSNSVERYDDGDIICVECGVCCVHRCLPMKPIDTGDDYIHDRALELMEQTYLVMNQSIDPYGYPSRILKRVTKETGYASWTNLSLIIVMMVEMIKWRKAIFYKGEWHSLG